MTKSLNGTLKFSYKYPKTKKEPKEVNSNIVFHSSAQDFLSKFNKAEIEELKTNKWLLDGKTKWFIVYAKCIGGVRKDIIKALLG